MGTFDRGWVVVVMMIPCVDEFVSWLPKTKGECRAETCRKTASHSYQTLYVKS
jgi:hypothetical protein